MERREPAENQPTRTHLPPPDAPAADAAPVETADHAPPQGPPGNTTGVSHPGTLPAPESAPVWAAGLIPVVPGYEIERELGRGGMGVVYLARHLSLKRLVALKIIKAGADATPDQLARFRAEAEAVASLQHPNVVQIYEIGEYNGCPFCSLEYVAGGTLAAYTRRRPQPPGEAAAVVETLARAVHHAHQKGIVHRDLKPANVLLSEERGPRTEDSKDPGVRDTVLSSGLCPLSSVSPKVSDFGLAKRLQNDDDSTRTRPGAVMGTPAYMAPEQAGGRGDEIGPRTDVYALGAILYELLAGRPPFTGDSGDAVVQAVLNSDVAAPSSVVPGLPRDLETVCLKCLEKEPARRYGSALALAHDLERYRAGEPILARRLGFVGKLWRKARKRAASIALVVACGFAVAVAAGGVHRVGVVREVAALGKDFEAALDAADWPPDHRDRMEALIERMAALDPAQADAARRKLLDRAAQRTRQTARNPRVTAADVAAVEADVRWLAERDPAAAADLDRVLKARLREWQVVFDLATPFADAASVFPPNSVRVEGAAMLPLAGRPVVLPAPTAVPSAGPVRYTAEFGAGWDAGSEFGIALDVPPGEPRADAGYSVVLVAVPRADESGSVAPQAPRPTFRSTENHAALVIRQGTATLRRVELQLPAGAVRLTLERDGDRLTARANNLTPVEHWGVVPARTGDGVFGVCWPAGVPLTKLRAENLPLPPAPSPLERADDLYARGRFADALPIYEEQARAADAAATEAACKAGLCLLELNRAADAVRVLEPLVGAVGDRWPGVAAVYLWVALLRENRFEDAEAVLGNLAIKFPREQLARLVPETVRAEIVGRYSVPTLSYYSPSQSTVGQLQARLRLTEIIQSDAQNAHIRYLLGVSHALVGNEAKAAEEFRRLVHRPFDREALRETVFDFPWVTRWYGWAVQRQGRPRDARTDLHNISKKVFALLDPDPSAVLDPHGLSHAHAVKVALARAMAMAGDAAGAEALLDDLLATPEFTRHARYAFSGEAWLMKGFLREQAGDPAGAVAAWKNGTVRAYQMGRPGDRGLLATPRGYDLYVAMLNGSLGGDLTDEEANGLYQAAVAAAGEGQVFTQLAGSVKLPPAVIRGMFRSERGKELARRMAFLDIAPAEYYLTPPRCLIYEMFRQDLFAGRPAADPDEVTWRAVVDLSGAFLSGRVGGLTLLQSAVAWKGTTGPLGWGGVSAALPPELRCQAAYMMGLRYRKLKRPADAKGMFATAAKDAPPDSTLQKLAREELARLETEK